MIGGKTRERDHIQVTSEGQIGRQGGRYLSVHRHTDHQQKKQNILPPQLHANSGHVQIENIK